MCPRLPAHALVRARMVRAADAPGMFAFLNMFALLLVVVLYFKGRFAPSTKDAGHSGNFSAYLPSHPPLPAHALGARQSTPATLALLAA